ncbi:MAG: hypothetical protein V1818_02365 [Candidatus Aenigmatarchaeota archaeon]
MERTFFAIAAILIISVLILSVPSENYFDNVIQDVREQGEESSALGVTYQCDRNLECFLVGCKSAGTPSFMSCVNTLAQETFYEDNCEGYWDVRVIQDFTKCACVQSLCKLIR